MTQASPGILILGGGVAGMSAALALGQRAVRVHLIEKQGRLGGNASDWACMATATCQNCGACLGHEMAARLEQADNISIHLNTELTALNRTDQGLEASLSSGKSLTAAKAILATGFTPFDPAEIPSYHTPNQKKLITTAQLNGLLRENRLDEIISGKTPRIAFLQCVGSRDREQNRDYCSQVCCKISIRHARKISHLIPDAEISLFYMDLQIIGKETRTMAKELSDTVRLVQGVPAEILENPKTGRLQMITEDPATSSRSREEFDLVVLSVGMRPGADLPGLSKHLGILPNDWGFFNTAQAKQEKEIYVIGCAQGPKDIPSAIQDGKIAAADILDDLGLRPKSYTDIAILGSGPQAAAIAGAIARHGHRALIFTRTASQPQKIFPQGVTDLGDAKILSIDGTIDNFSIFYQDQDKKQTLTCNAIITAPHPENHPRRTDFPGALSLAAYTAIPLENRPENSLILLDYFGPESKAQARQALFTAMETRATGRQVDVLMNKMLVHGPEGQQLYDRARKSGIRFLRYETPSDLNIDTRKTGFEISLKEATLPGMDLVLTPATLVIPDTSSAASNFPELGRLLKLGLDREGFLQPANVRHRLVQSLRRGIYFAGSGHDDIDENDLDLEIRAILSEIENQPPQAEGRVSINTKACAKCLTCYRVCPHGAVVLDENQRPFIIQEACFDCQACVSNCPAYAIDSHFTNADLADRVKKGRTLVFACERSGTLAAPPLPPDTDLVSLPCACRLSSDLILKALIQGADRVIVSGCHQGNCRSGEGTAIARQGVDAVSAMPGIPAGKVAWQSVAANEPVAFAQTISGAPNPRGLRE